MRPVGATIYRVGIAPTDQQRLTQGTPNNDAERALRHVVLGRKNFAGSRTINGADVAADLYTVIETAKKSGLQPKDYMKYVITENWHSRPPKSPTAFAQEKFGVNKRVKFPAKDQWKIDLVSPQTPLTEI